MPDIVGNGVHHLDLHGDSLFGVDLFRKILIEDENGIICAKLDANMSSPGLWFYDEKGQLRVSMSVVAGTPSLMLSDENGKLRARLDVTFVGSRLRLLDENENDRVWLWAARDGPRLLLFDENGIPRADLDVSEDGPGMRLSDENNKMRFVAGKTKTVSPDGKTIEYPESSLILFGPDGKVIWSAIK